MVQRAQPRELIRRPRDLARLGCLLWQSCLVDVFPTRCVPPRIQHNVVPFVNLGLRHAEGLQGAYDHVRVLVAVEDGRRADDAVVRVSLVVEDGSAAAPATDEIHALRMADWVLEQREVDFHPRVLVAPDHDAGSVRVQEEDGRVGRALLQEVVLDGEVKVGVVAARDVDLGLARGGGCDLGEVGGEAREARGMCECMLERGARQRCQAP